MFFALLLTSALLQGGAQVATSPLIDNDRVSVQEVSGPVSASSSDAVMVSLTGSATFVPKGTTPNGNGRSVVIRLKAKPHSLIENKSNYPLAFPRQGSKKLLENAHVVVWDYSWEFGVATPMHFHDKDVVVVFLDDGELKSTTLDGKATVNPYKFADVRFNRGDRTHTETLIRGKQRAIITELK